MWTDPWARTISPSARSEIVCILKLVITSKGYFCSLNKLIFQSSIVGRGSFRCFTAFSLFLFVTNIRSSGEIGLNEWIDRWKNRISSMSELFLYSVMVQWDGIDVPLVDRLTGRESLDVHNLMIDGLELISRFRDIFFANWRRILRMNDRRLIISLCHFKRGLPGRRPGLSCYLINKVTVISLHLLSEKPLLKQHSLLCLLDYCLLFRLIVHGIYYKYIKINQAKNMY